MTTILPITRESAIITTMRGFIGKNAQLQETTLRFEHVLTPNTVSKKFNFTGDGQNKRPNEIFLGLNDVIVVYALRIGIQKIKDTSLDGNSGNSPVYTYPDKFVFSDPAAGTSVSEADALMAIWNGQMSLKTNSIELQNIMELSQFYRANQTQESATTQAQLNDCGFVDINMPPIISGRDTTILDFVPAQGADLALIGGAAETQNILVVQYKAIVARNAAQGPSWTELLTIMDKEYPNRVL